VELVSSDHQKQVGSGDQENCDGVQSPDNGPFVASIDAVLKFFWE